MAKKWALVDNETGREVTVGDAIEITKGATILGPKEATPELYSIITQLGAAVRVVGPGPILVAIQLGHVAKLAQIEVPDDESSADSEVTIGLATSVLIT